MSYLITYGLLVSVGLYVVLLVWEAIALANYRRVVVQLCALAIALLVLRVTTGFPVIRTSFGTVTSPIAIGLMLFCVGFGIAARYFFYLRGRFSWRQFLKPLVISPIVLLPLLGSLPTTSAVESIQMISFALLSFQNGFFWVAVLE